MDGQAGISFTEFVDVSDHTDLFELVDNTRILQLSRLGSEPGFSSLESISRSTGVRRRRILRTGREALDVAVAVAEKLQRRVGFCWRRCPAVGLSHSHLDPARAPELARRLAGHLGLGEEKFFLLNHGCVGFLELVCRAMSRLSAVPHRTHIPLLLVETPEEWHDAADRSFSGIIAAGGAGTTLWKGPGHRLVHAVTEAVPCPGRSPESRPLFVPERRHSYDFSAKAQQRTVMTMDAEAVFLNGVELMLEAARESGHALQSFRRVIVIPHQASGKMVGAFVSVARRSLPSAEFVTYLADQGNTIACTIPTILARIDEALSQNGCRPVQPGDALLLVAAGICFARPADHLEKGRAALIWQPGAYRS